MNANEKEYQEIFDKLAELEKYFFYKLKSPEDLAPYFRILVEMHASSKELVRQWHNLTGCKNQ